MKGIMRAAVFKDIEQIVVEEREIPICPKNGVLVKVHSCGICGGDVRNYHNGLKGGITNQIMGHEIAGEVVEVDSGVTRFKTGDRVALAPDVSCGECWYCKRGLVNLCLNHRMLGTHFPGGYAQYIALPEDVMRHGFVEPIPEGMSYDEAAFAETAAAVIACQNYNNVSLGDTVVIIGDGPVGCLHIEVARARGAKKIIVIGRDKIELAKSFGPDDIFENSDPTAVTASVRELTDGIGADFVICAVPTVAVQQQALEMVRKRGKVIIYGGVAKTRETTQLNSNIIHYNEIMLLGAFSYPATGLQDALSAIATGKITASKYFSAHVSLEHIVDGMKMVEKGEALKVIISPWLEQ
jgi:L-iditol 2-dehydrogenase